MPEEKPLDRVKEPPRRGRSRELERGTPRSANAIERRNREIRGRTRAVGCFPDGNSALMLVCACLRHGAGTQWGSKKYMNMKHLEAVLENASIAG